jgi:hypothetical protein
MKDTAVEWLRKQIILNSKLRESKTGKISFTIGLSMLDKLPREAKEIEKEQNHAEYMRGWKDGLTKQQEQ